ncbi:MAG: V-type ATPase subunit [Phycisphaerae bacterium]|nr:V-type ATPase subunit [Phycisphaerae bacterium]
MFHGQSDSPTVEFHRYPPIGEDDWRYGFAVGQVRSLETRMLSRATLLDLANADSADAALDLLSGTDYALPAGGRGTEQIEQMLRDKRTEVRRRFASLMQDPLLVELLEARDDFSNLRLAIRRLVTERPIGVDYSIDGSIPADQFEEILQAEDFGRFPEHLQEAVESAVLGYYESKDIRRIDYELDKAQATYKLRRARELGCEFLCSLFRIQIDLINIRMMMRLKAAGREDRNLFLPGGFVGIDKFLHAMELGYEAVPPVFFATPYFEVVEGGIAYWATNQSFLRLERLCEEYIMGFLRQTTALAAGWQPIVAYLLLMEQEIRTVRMILTGKYNGLDVRLILDRLGE